MEKILLSHSASAIHNVRSGIKFGLIWILLSRLGWVKFFYRLQKSSLLWRIALKMANYFFALYWFKMACSTCDSEVATIIQILHNCVKNPQQMFFFRDNYSHSKKSYIHYTNMKITKCVFFLLLLPVFRFYFSTFLFWSLYTLYICIHTRYDDDTFVITLLDIFAE